MTRVSRMMLIIGVMVLIGLSVLYFMAKRLRTAVQDVPPATQQVVGDDPIPIPLEEGETAAAVIGTPEQPVMEQPVAAPEPDPLQDRIAIFADARYAVWEVLEKYPVVRESIRKELTDTVDTDQVKMFFNEFMEIRVARGQPLAASGMDEEEYKAIREQYRAYRGGEGNLDPAFKAAFDAAPEEVMNRANLDKYELLDY